jgi:hypothetical protein
METNAQQQGPHDEEHSPNHVIHFKVDGSHLTIGAPDSTPNEILRLASIDPTTHYLVRINGRKRESFQDKGDLGIKVHQGDVFISVSVGPTPVS